MPAPETLAVIRDVIVVAMIALAAALVVYELARKHGDVAWNLEGNVLTRPYDAVDGVVALFLLVYLCGAYFVPVEPGVVGAHSSGIPVDVGTLLLTIVHMLVLCLLVLLHIRVVRGLNPAEMFGLRQMPLKRVLRFAVVSLILTVLGGVLVMLALIGLNGGDLPDSTTQQESVEAFENGGSLTYRITLAFIAVVTAPISEELLFRGFLYGVVKRFTDRWFAAIFTAVIFAVVHGHVGTIPQLFLLGLGLAIAYEQTGCLLVPIFMHAMFNGWNVAMLVYSASTN